MKLPMKQTLRNTSARRTCASSPRVQMLPVNGASSELLLNPHNCLPTARGQVPATQAAVTATNLMEELAPHLKSAHAGTQPPLRAALGSHGPRAGVSASHQQLLQRGGSAARPGAQGASAGRSGSVCHGKELGSSVQVGSMELGSQEAQHPEHAQYPKHAVGHSRRRMGSCHYLNPILLPPPPSTC